jgi:hypothetical protein
MKAHERTVKEQRRGRGNLAFNNDNQVTLVAAEAHVRIIRTMDRHRDDAQVQETACGALMNLAENNANQVTLVAAEAHVCISASPQSGRKSRAATAASRPTLTASSLPCARKSRAWTSRQPWPRLRRAHPATMPLARRAWLARAQAKPQCKRRGAAPW